MRTFEYRVYTLRNHEALVFYSRTVYPRHLHSFPLFGVEAHGFWTAKNSNTPTLHVLVSYGEGEDPGEVSRRYMKSPEFAEDIRDFDMAEIVGVESTILVPSASSPLK